ncbi:sensor domain-containing diguanylate cyclase [Diaphorobacter ruginosibacter]|uniref:sensor domain-containing diguanylate cyclase n=1 Tax=Diaphorobacter ruginosibacter TaxID=1715720 RepID=UPI001FE609C7|nr:diguanylate cyclase [Diaphorobacter ruginosibacter]
MRHPAPAPTEHDDPDSEIDGTLLSELHVPGPLVRRMMLIALLCVALAGGLAAWVISHASGEEMTERLVRQQTDEVELVARLLASKVEQSQKVLGTVAEGITPQMLQSPSLLEWVLKQGLPAVRFFDAMEIARADGRLILNLQSGKMEPAASVDMDERDILLRTMVQGKPLVSGVLGTAAASARVMFTLPLVADDGKVVGVVGGVLRLQSQGLLPHSLGLPARDDSRLIVFTSDGVILSHPQLERVMGNVRSEPGLDKAYAQWRSELKPISTGRGDTVVVQDRLISMAGVPMPQWWVARVTESHALLAPLHGTHRSIWWTAAACVTAVGLLAMLAMAWVAAPLTRLHRRAQSILLTQGLPDSQPPTSAESDLLSGALDHLEAQQLHHGHQAEFSRLQLQGILEQAPVGIVITRNDQLELLSQQASLMLGFSRAELEGQLVKRLFADEAQFETLERQMREGAITRGGYEGEFALRRKDGSLLWARVLGRMAFDRTSAMAAVWVLEDMATTHEERHSPQWSRSHDALTNLPNRTAFLERLKAQLVRNAELARAEQLSAGSGVALLFIDVDHFTLVNDRLGHEAGDMLLKQFSSLLEELVRHVGWAARLGGDEFAVVLPDCTAARAEMIAEHIRASVEEWEFVYEGEASITTVSIGIVVAPADLEEVTPWLRAADMACYYAKRAGRNRVVVREVADKASA